jgi:hypothetical protein
MDDGFDASSGHCCAGNLSFLHNGSHHSSRLDINEMRLLLYLVFLAHQSHGDLSNFAHQDRMGSQTFAHQDRMGSQTSVQAWLSNHKEVLIYPIFSRDNETSSGFATLLVPVPIGN